MKKVCIIGGGFAGLAAAGALLRVRPHFSLTIVNRFPEMHMRLLLPDAVSRTISLPVLKFPLASYARKMSFEFIHDEAVDTDFDQNSVLLKSGKKVDYDYLIVATGSRVNFFGNEKLERYSLKLENCADAEEITRKLEQERTDRYLICGGGYTGVEIATHLRIALQKIRIQSPIEILEMKNTILSSTPQWMIDYTIENLKRMNITVRTNTKVEDIDSASVELSDGEMIDNACVIWTAGMQSDSLVQKWDFPANSQGRLKVGKDLRFKENCFAVGDAACFNLRDQEDCFRMSAQASQQSGAKAAYNIIALDQGKQTKPLQFTDLGFIIPMANARSCGRTLLGTRLKGRTATLVHYFMGAFRSKGINNAWHVLSRGTAHVLKF